MYTIYSKDYQEGGRAVKKRFACIYCPHWARVVGYGPFSLCVIHKEGLSPSSGDVNRLMMMIKMYLFVLFEDLVHITGISMSICLARASASLKSVHADKLACEISRDMIAVR
jgi:hypothetical protein